MLKIGWLYRFTKHWIFVFSEKSYARAYSEIPAWQPWPRQPGRSVYKVARTMPPETIFMVVAKDSHDGNLCQILYDGDKIGWLNYRASAEIDTSLNP